MRCAKRRGAGGAEDFHPITGVMAGRKIVLVYIKLLRDRDIEVGEMPSQAWRVGVGPFREMARLPRLSMFSSLRQVFCLETDAG